MKRLYALLIGALLIATSAMAQTFTVLPNDSTYNSVDLNHAANPWIYFVNTSNNPIVLQWDVTTQTFPSPWVVQLCDNRVCRNLPFTGAHMAPVQPGDSGYLHLTAAPNGTVPGDLLVTVAVSDSAQPSSAVNVTFQVHAGTTAVANPQLRAQLSITPNPTSDFLHLRAKAGSLQKGTAKVYDLRGQVVLSQPIAAVQATELDLRALDPGIYLLRYETKLGIVTEKVMVSK